MAAASVVEVDPFVARNSFLFSVPFSFAQPFPGNFPLTLSLFLPDPFSRKFPEVFFLSLLLKSLLFQKFFFDPLSFNLFLLMAENRTYDAAPRHPIELIPRWLSNRADLKTFGTILML